jgi:hypothetical protein
MHMKKSLRYINLLTISLLLLTAFGSPGRPAALARSAGAVQEASDSLMPPPLNVFQGMIREDSAGDLDVFPAAGDPNDIMRVIGAVPDTSGAPGLMHYMQAVNESIGLFLKDGTVIEKSTFATFWSYAATGTDCDSEQGDTHHGQPYVMYDHLHNRWVVADVAFLDANVDTGPYYICVAVSTGLPAPLVPGPYFIDVDGTAQDFWSYYALSTDEGNEHFYPDMPKLGLWNDGYYLSANLYDLFNGGQNRTPRGAKVWALNDEDLANAVETGYRFVHFFLPEYMGYRNLVPTNLLGNPAPMGTPNFFASIQPGKFFFWRFKVDWQRPNQSTFGTAAQEPNTTLNTDTATLFAMGNIIPEPRTILAFREQVDANGDRLMSPLQYRILDGIPTLWANHTILSGGITGIRWYEFQIDDNLTPYVYQKGTHRPDTHLYRWMGSLAVDKAGDMALGYSASRFALVTDTDNLYPDIRYAGRLVTDPLGHLSQGEQILQIDTLVPPGVFPAYDGTQWDADSLYDGPWGRQSQMGVDPLDECVFWYTNMYYDNDDISQGYLWRTAIGWFSFPECRGRRLTRISLSTHNIQGNAASGVDFDLYSVAVSGTGRYVVFSSQASNLVTAPDRPDTNGKWDIFLRDRDTDEDGIYDEPGAVRTTRVTDSSWNGSAEPNGDSWEVSITPDGRYVAFSSDASNLVNGDTNGDRDVFVWDRLTDNTVRISMRDNSISTGGNAKSDQPSITGSGRFVAFRSYSSNLVNGDTNVASDVFVRDRDADADGIFDETGAVRTMRVSVGPGAPPIQTEVGADSLTPSLAVYSVGTNVGLSVAFASESVNMGVAKGFTPGLDVYITDWVITAGVWGLVNNAPVGVSVIPAGGTTGDNESYFPSISADGLHVAFASRATNLITTDTNGFADVFVFDRDAIPLTTFLVTRVSVNFFGGQAENGDSYAPSISANGQYITFASNATNLDVFAPDLTILRDVFLHTRILMDDGTYAPGLTQRISLSTELRDPNDRSLMPVVTLDESDGWPRIHVIFPSKASNLVTNDTNSAWDVFAWDSRRTIPVFLRIPPNVPGMPGQIVSVPVNFYENDEDIDAVAFSIDYDEDCLTFDPLVPNPVVFSVSDDFIWGYTFDPDDTDAELDIHISDRFGVQAFLTDGPIVTIKFRVKGTCAADPGSTNSARVGFSANPRPSFGSVGLSVRGIAVDGFVAISAGHPGDCNGDSRVDAGDLSAEILEIFDDDGWDPIDVPGSTFPGNPVGCNPNHDTIVDAGDLSCIVQIIYGGGSAACSAMTARLASEPVVPVTLSLPQSMLTAPGGLVVMPITLNSSGKAVNSAIFSVDFDETWLSFDKTDANGDGQPDAIVWALPQGYLASASYDAADKDGELDFVVYNPASPSAQLPDGVIAYLTLKTGGLTGDFLAVVKSSDNPPASFGSAAGQSLAGLLQDGSVWFTSDTNWLFAPLVWR